MKEYKVYYHFNRGKKKEGYIYTIDLRAVDKYQAIAKVQKFYLHESSFSIIKVEEIEETSYWHKIKNSNKIKVFYKCSNCGNCVHTPTKKCSHCGNSMTIWKEI